LLLCYGYPGEYTAEKLAALQAATQKLPAKLKPAAAGDSSGSTPAEAAAGGVIKLSGSFRQVPKQSDDRFAYSYSIHGTMSGSNADAGAAAGVVQRSGGSSAAMRSSSVDDVGHRRAIRNQAIAAGTAAGVADVGNGGTPGDEEAMPLPPPPRPSAAAATAAKGGRAPAATADRANLTNEDMNGTGSDGDDEDGAGGFLLPDKETIRCA